MLVASINGRETRMGDGEMVVKFNCNWGKDGRGEVKGSM